MNQQKSFKNPANDALFEAILSLQTKEECYSFFEDLCTIKELQSISQRWEVAMLLNQKKTYIEIEEVTKASTATISRINKCLIHGAGGYSTMLEKINK